MKASTQHHTMDPEGGLSFDEQIQELEAATAAVQKHMGDDVVARFGTDTFSPAAVKERALPQVCDGSGYHLQITFDIAADRDLQELYDQAAAVAADPCSVVKPRPSNTATEQQPAQMLPVIVH